MESCTLHSSMFISILEISIIGYSFTIFKLSLWWRYYPPFTAEEPKVCKPVSCFAPGYSICLPKTLPAALLALWKCKNLWASATRSGSPSLHTASTMSLLAQQQQWKIQHITKAWTDSESLMPLATIKHSYAQVSKPGLAGSVAEAVQPHLHHRSRIFPGQKQDMQCPINSYLILWTLCDFLGLFLKLYTLNISCYNAAYQLTSQEEFLNFYKLIIPATHRSFLW